MMNDRKCLRIRHQPENYSELLNFPPKTLSPAVQVRQAGRWQCNAHQTGRRWKGWKPPSAFRIIISFNTPFCTSAPSESGDSGDRSQPSLASVGSVRQSRRTCKINHPATGDWKLRRNTQQQRSLRRPRFIISPRRKGCPSPSPILDRRNKQNGSISFFDPIIIKHCPP